mmetsp:Transcript_10301/g.35852  ORF Transcript_10301/g.35852 Transcript_10301/m.35852 type:complete len:200 (-) Transcript_10301:1239-1838(-)
MRLELEVRHEVSVPPDGRGELHVRVQPEARVSMGARALRARRHALPQCHCATRARRHVPELLVRRHVAWRRLATERQRDGAVAPKAPHDISSHDHELLHKLPCGGRLREWLTEPYLGVRAGSRRRGWADAYVWVEGSDGHGSAAAALDVKAQCECLHLQKILLLVWSEEEQLVCLVVCEAVVGAHKRWCHDAVNYLAVL